MTRPRVPDAVERDALALFEQLADIEDQAERTSLLAAAAGPVRARVAALLASDRAGAATIPTLVPGAGRDDPPPPDRIGAFRLVRRIGRGGMGDVWLGERADGLFDQRVAVKLIRADALVRAAAAFEAERRFLARLEHPGIARLIDGGVTPAGLPWLATEYVDGRTADAAVAGLSDAGRVALVRAVAAAVQAAHARLIAHGDIKPSNIMVTGDGQVKLLDFGIARLIGEEGSPEGLPLTPAFSSPERLAGAPPSVADDVFALGRTLEALVDVGADAELAAIAARATAPAATRYGSVEALVADLDRRRDDLPVAAMPDTGLYRARKFVGRHRMGVFATGLALAALGGTSLVANANYARAERERAVATARFEDARGSARYVAMDLLGELATRPGTLALRTRAAMVAQRYLDRLATGAEATAAVRLDAAEGLLRLAAAQGRPGEPNLGQTAAASANLDRAAALVAPATDLDRRRLLTRIRLDQARLAANADVDARRALARLDEARALLASDPQAPVMLRARYHAERANALDWQANYAAARSSAQAALALLAGADNRDALLLRAAAYDSLAEAIYYGEGPGAALDPYRAELAAVVAAARHAPGDAVVERRSIKTRYDLATTLLAVGRAAAALPLLDGASRSARAIIVADPADADARRLLRVVENARAQTLAATGRVAAGLALLESVVAERRALATRRPGEAGLARDHFVAVKSLGDVQVDYGRRVQGCATYARADALVAAGRRAGWLARMDERGTLLDLAARQRRYCGG